MSTTANVVYKYPGFLWARKRARHSIQ